MKNETHSEVPDLVLLRVLDAARMLGISKSKMYQLIYEGTIPAIRVGKSIRVVRSSLSSWIAAQPGIVNQSPQLR
jgi:excisionase family DNA binding protein